MTKIYFNDDSNLDSLILIIEQWNLVLDEMNDLHHSFAELPFDLIALKQYLNGEINKSDRSHGANAPSTWNPTAINNAVKYLDRALLRLLEFNNKTKNLVALRERIEAIQDNNKGVHNIDYEREFSRFKYPNKQLFKKPHKLQLAQQIKQFKSQYPENFWSIIIAFFLLLIFSWRATASPLAKSELSYSNLEELRHF